MHYTFRLFCSFYWSRHSSLDLVGILTTLFYFHGTTFAFHYATVWRRLLMTIWLFSWRATSLGSQLFAAILPSPFWLLCKTSCWLCSHFNALRYRTDSTTIYFYCSTIDPVWVILFGLRCNVLSSHIVPLPPVHALESKSFLLPFMLIFIDSVALLIAMPFVLLTQHVQ